jgi:hypothetical protein
MSTKPIDFSDLGGIPEDAQPTQTAAVGQNAPQAAKPAIDFSDLGGVAESAPQPAAEPGMLERAGNFLEAVHNQGPLEVGKGLLKGAGDTLVGLIGDRSGEGDTSFLSAKVGMDPDAISVAKKDAKDFHEKTLPAANEAQETGKALEMVAEFITGDAAFSKLGALDKIRKLERAAATLEKYPVIGRILQRSITSGASAGGVELLKTDDPEKAAEAAVAGAIGGGLFEGGSAAGRKAFSFGKDGTKKIVSSFWDSATGRTLQKETQASIRGTLEGAATDAGVAAKSSGAQPTIANSARSVAERIEEKSKALFKQVDDATDGKLTNVQNKIKNVQRELRMKAGTDATVEERLLEQQAALNAELDDLILKIQISKI